MVFSGVVRIVFNISIFFGQLSSFSYWVSEVMGITLVYGRTPRKTVEDTERTATEYVIFLPLSS